MRSRAAIFAFVGLAGLGASLSRLSHQDPRDEGGLLNDATIGKQRYRLPIDSTEEAIQAIRENPPLEAREVAGLLVPQARQLIIQIDMAHGNTQSASGSLPFHKHMLHVSQIAQHLAMILGSKKIYHDGITAQFLDQLKRDFISLSAAAPDEENLQRIDRLSKLSPIFEAALDYQTIEIQPTESEEVLDSRAKVSAGSDAALEYYDEQRENFILQLISTNPEPVAILLLGAKHNLKPNILNWNNLNPGSQFSFLRLRPNELPADENLDAWVRDRLAGKE